MYWFYLFKVVVGKSYCYRRRDEERRGNGLGSEGGASPSDFSKVPLPPNYDTVYLEGESPRK
jgi:hypothetical protein